MTSAEKAKTEGYIMHLGDIHSLTLGESDGSDLGCVEAIASAAGPLGRTDKTNRTYTFILCISRKINESEHHFGSSFTANSRHW
jgi:hypothetical protein